MPVKEAVINFDNDSQLQIRTRDDAVVISGKTKNRRYGAFTLKIRTHDEVSPTPWLRQVADGIWRDLHSDELLNADEVYRDYGIHVGWEFPKDLPEKGRWLEKEFSFQVSPILIETGRLDLRAKRPGREVHLKQGRPVDRIQEARIIQYVERISSLVTDARRKSLAISQKADREFAARSLDKDRTTTKEAELRERYARVSSLNQELHRNGLTEETINLEFPSGRTNLTERRILNLFLDDWEAKLSPLVPIHEKIELLREIVGKKLATKRMTFDNRGILRFYSLTDEEISVSMLSSGEQHLLALFTMLLFNAAEGSLVLIDEPEISLHAAWKHAFLADIERVAMINDLQIVVATHSTAIINGRWDLVEELDLEVE